MLLVRVCALTPPNVVARLTDADLPMTLNLDMALVGPSGSGKGKIMSHARHLIPTPETTELVEVKPKTGESIPAKFVSKIPKLDADGKPVKGEYEDDIVASKCLVLIPEIVSLRASMNRQGSTMLPTLLEGFSNEPLGDDTKGKQYQIKIPPYAYRLAGVVGVQPSNSGVLFDEADTGLAGRFLYMPSTDPDAPPSCEKPDRPADPFPFDLYDLPMSVDKRQREALYEFGSREAMPGGGERGYPLTEITFPAEASGYADTMQLLSCRGEADPLDAHRIEIVARIAALLAIMERRTEVDTEDWRLALTLMDKSDETRAVCLSQKRQSAVNWEAERIATKNDAMDQVETRNVGKAKARILKLLQDNPSGMTRKQLVNACSGGYRKSADAAIEHLYSTGEISSNGDDEHTVWYPA
ncbi:DUF3987 domain-containing protein [Bifidobacterium aerophilum]|uniref:Uncharacterized protein n=1 Tax=Bifidobacterium aerophilum TaxID=1798155 RepID=A0A6N9Z2X4_9BIFI|nr:DUF3987 domain-containing protein [Bifidobacterium aerophilum]NEG88603.1 hypothetical protein [Bifidobacterium aerophilum]